MKKIKENGLNELKGYEELNNGEKFIYINSCEWFAIKFNEEYAVLINGCNKFIVAKRYKNCLSIGSGYVKEYSSYEEAETSIKSEVRK